MSEKSEDRIVLNPEDEAVMAFDAEHAVEPGRTIAERIAEQYCVESRAVDEIAHAIEDGRALGEKRGALPFRWRPIETAPKDTAVLTYGFGYEVAHFNTLLGKWVACWDHRPIHNLTLWMPLPPA